jgi:hypothetical protein
LLRGVYLSANASLGITAVMTLYIYHMTTASTPVFSLSLTGTSSRSSLNNSQSYKFHSGDLMFVTLTGTGSNVNSALRSFQVNVGLF